MCLGTKKKKCHEMNKLFLLTFIFNIRSKNKLTNRMETPRQSEICLIFCKFVVQCSYKTDNSRFMLYFMVTVFFGNYII